MPEKLVIDAINSSRNVVVAGHVNPDGDAVGASLALAMVLEKIGKNVSVVLEGYNPRFDVIPGKWLLYEGDLGDLEPDTFIALDCGDAERLGEAGVFLGKAAVTVNIDHHTSNTLFAWINYVDVETSSTSEIIFRIVNKIFLIDKKIATALYAGIVYDTGGFRHNSTTIGTIEAAGMLMSLGIPFTDIYNTMMHTHSLTETKIMGKALSNLRLFEKGQIAYTYLDENDFAEAGATNADLNGICEYALNTVGVKVAVLIYQKGEGCKISFRSKSVFVNKIAEKLGGGGHELAAGCDFHGTIDEAWETVLGMLC